MEENIQASLFDRFCTVIINKQKQTKQTKTNTWTDKSISLKA